jgi:hypothetical protein
MLVYLKLSLMQYFFTSVRMGSSLNGTNPWFRIAIWPCAVSVSHPSANPPIVATSLVPCGITISESE